MKPLGFPVTHKTVAPSSAPGAFCTKSTQLMELYVARKHPFLAHGVNFPRVPTMTCPSRLCSSRSPVSVCQGILKLSIWVPWPSSAKSRCQGSYFQPSERAWKTMAKVASHLLSPFLFLGRKNWMGGKFTSSEACW